MTSGCVTSFLLMTSAVAVTTLLLLMSVMTTAQVSSLITSSTLSWSVVGADQLGLQDEGVCRTRYLSSANHSEAGGGGEGEEVVEIAVILELRRPEGGGCGAVSAMELQTVAALFWALRRLNDQPPTLGLGPYIPGVRLGVRVYDDCSHDVLAARHVGELLSVHPDFNCTPHTPPLAGFLGTTTSHTTSFVAGLLSRTQIPHFGTSATVSVLSNNQTYPTFFRTVPSDVTQSKVLVDLVLQLQWTYVVGIYTRDNYGTEGFQEFKRLATRAGVCVFKEASFWHSDQDVEGSMERFIRELLIELGNTRFSSLGVVYFGHDTEATILFKMIHDRRSRWHNQDKINRLYWLVSDGVGTSSPMASLVKPYTLLSISPATSHLQDVRDFFFQALDRPEDLGPYWQTLVTDHLQGVQRCFHTASPVRSCKLRERIESFDYLPAALDSFYSLVALLGRGHELSCGRGTPGVCRNMSEVLKEGLLSLVRPQALNYSQHFSPERLPAQFRQDRMLVPDQFGDFMPANSPLYFINFASNGQWRKIGEYCNGSLTFHQPSSSSSSSSSSPSSSSSSDLSTIPRSECGTDCPQCRQQGGAIRFAYQPGDVLLLGLYSISSPKGPTSFGCGDYRKQSSSVAALLAFLQSVETLGAGVGGSGGRRFGALVLDDCYNKLTASALLADLFSGKTTLRDPSSGVVIDMKKVVAVIGSQSSSVTLSALSLLTPLRIPAISYSATSPDLDDRLSYPYFLRPVPSDSLQARALVDLVRVLNITYVGALHQNNNYGWRGIQTFVALAHEAGICVETPVAVNEGDSEVDLHEALRDIRNKDAKVVVVFIVEPTVLKLLDAIQGRNLDLIFLASEAWTLSADTLHAQRGMTARGSLVLTVDTSREAGNIKMAEYLQKLQTPSLATSAQELPWLREFWENEQQCNLPGGFSNAYSAMCAPRVTLQPRVVRELAGDQKVVQTINAVTSVITAFTGRCGKQSDPAACMLTLPAPETTQLIRSVQLRDQSDRSFRPYLSNGNGNVGFALHNVQKTAAGTYSYVQVGHYHPEQGLQLQKNIIFYNLVGQPLKDPISSFCQYKLQCRHVCGQGSGSTPTPPITAPTAPQEGEDGAGRGGLVAGVVVLTVVCVALAAVVVTGVCCAKRRGRVPCLGVLMRRKQENASVEFINRTPRTGDRRREMEGVSNSGFLPSSPRVSQPLPPLPASSIEASALDQYNELAGEADRRFSGSSQTSGSSRAASPALYVDGSHYDYSEDDRLSRRPRRHQVRSQSQQQDLRRQLQEMLVVTPGQIPELQRFQSTPDTTASAVAGQDRPRARSVPRVERPHFLPVRGLSQPGVSPGVSVVGGAQGASPRPGRPRSHSHDAAFRARLGALSEDEQQILLKYLHIARQQSLSPQAPSLSPVASSHIAEEPERPTFFLQPAAQGVDAQLLQSAMPPPPPAEHMASPHPVFDNPPPSFCSSSRIHAGGGGGGGGGRPEDPALLYLHAIPSERDLYLEVLADPSQPSPPPPASQSPPSHSPPISAVAVASSSTSPPPAAASPHRTRTSQSPGEKPTSPRTPFSASSIPVTSLLSPVSMTSPLTSVRGGSTASESSGAVFVSPDQEIPSPFKYSPSPKNAFPKATAAAHADPRPTTPQHPTYLPLKFSPQEESGRTAPGVAALSSSSSSTSSSSTQQHPSSVSPAVQGRAPSGGNPSPLSAFSCSSPLSPQQTSPPAFPGVVVRDSAGAMFWLPGVMMPPSVQASASSPGVFPQGGTAGLVSPGFQPQEPHRGDPALSPVSAGPLLKDLTPNHNQHTALPTVCTYQQQQQQTSVTSTPVAVPPQPQTVTLTPTQTLTPAYRQPQQQQQQQQQQTPTTLTPFLGQQPATQSRSPKPRMGVDSLSARKLSDVRDPRYNSDSELCKKETRSISLSKDSAVRVLPGEASLCSDPNVHPGSPQRTQSSEVLAGDVPSSPGIVCLGTQSSEVLAGDVSPSPGVVILEGHSAASSPSPCKTLDSPEVTGSGGSDHTSGDSGTGEDLNNYADNVDSRIEVCV